MVNTHPGIDEKQRAARKYRGKRRKKGVLYLSGKKMKKCRKEIKYSDKTIKYFIEKVAKPALRGKKFMGKVYRGHMVLVILNYCSTQYSEVELKSHFELKRESSIKNLKIGAREFAWYIRSSLWEPVISSELMERRRFSFENFGDVGGEDYRHITFNIDGKPVKSRKFSRTNSSGSKLSGKNLNKYWYDEKLKAPGKRFLALRSSHGKWRGCSKMCYPSGKFKEGTIVKEDPYCKKWFSLMNEKDCIAADSGIGPSIKKLLGDSNEYYYEDETSPVINETNVNYPPVCRSTYSSEIQRKLKSIKKSHIKFGKMNIERSFGQLVHKNPGILSKNNVFRTDDGVFCPILYKHQWKCKILRKDFLMKNLKKRKVNIC